MPVLSSLAIQYNLNILCFFCFLAFYSKIFYGLSIEVLLILLKNAQKLIYMLLLMAAIFLLSEKQTVLEGTKVLENPNEKKR
jgi:hypothetical protein